MCNTCLNNCSWIAFCRNCLIVLDRCVMNVSSLNVIGSSWTFRHIGSQKHAASFLSILHRLSTRGHCPAVILHVPSNAQSQHLWPTFESKLHSEPYAHQHFKLSPVQFVVHSCNCQTELPVPSETPWPLHLLSSRKLFLGGSLKMKPTTHTRISLTWPL